MLLVSCTRPIEMVLLSQKIFITGFLEATKGLEPVVSNSAALVYQMTVLVGMHIPICVCLSLVNCLKSDHLLKRYLGIDFLMRIITGFWQMLKVLSC